MERSSRTREWLAVATLVLVAKLAWIALDPTLRVFMGDSASYLHSADTGVPPTDRSFVYPLLLRWFALPADDLAPVLWGQTLLGTATALVAFGMLRTWMSVGFPVAAAAACAITLEPSQLLFERMVMAESAGTFCFVVALACGVGYVGTRAARLLVYAAIAGLGAAGLRLSLLPVVLGLAIVPPLVLAFDATRRRDPRAALAAAFGLALSLAATALAHACYQRWLDDRNDAMSAPGYSGREGAMRLALVAPLVRPEHLERQGLSPSLLDEVARPLSDPAMRELQMWADDGLVAVVTRAFARHDDAERVMRKIAMRAVREDLDGFLALAAWQARGYFDPAIAQHRLGEDLGHRGPDARELAWMFERFGYDGAGIAGRETATTRWYAATRWWLTACLFLAFPLALAATFAQRRAEPAPGAVLALVAAGMTAAQLLFSAIVSYRYLHAFPIVVIVTLAWWLSAAVSREEEPLSRTSPPCARHPDARPRRAR